MSYLDLYQIGRFQFQLTHKIKLQTDMQVLKGAFTVIQIKGAFDWQRVWQLAKEILWYDWLPLWQIWLTCNSNCDPFKNRVEAQSHN